MSNVFSLEVLVASFVVANDRNKVELKTADFKQERTRLTQAKPFGFYALPTVPGKTRSEHQFGGNSGLPASMMVFMPSAELFEATGNPYPKDAKHPANKTNDKSYKYCEAFTIAAHHMFNLLMTGSEVSAQEVFYKEEFRKVVCEDIKAQYSYKSYSFDHADNWKDSDIGAAIHHALRELEVCGLIVAVNGKRGSNDKFKVQECILSAAKASKEAAKASKASKAKKPVEAENTAA